MQESGILHSKVAPGQKNDISDPVTGLRKKARILSHTLWVPFDKRYAEVLSRMKKHEVAFAEEMKLANTKISVSSHKLLEGYIEEARLDRQEQRELVEEQNLAALRKCELSAFVTPLKPFRPEAREYPDVDSRHRVPAHF